MPRSTRRAHRVAVTVVAAAVLVACDGGDEPSGATDPPDAADVDGGAIPTGPDDESAEGPIPVAQPPGDDPEAGTLSFSIGADGPFALELDECRLDLDDGGNVSAAVRVVASGPDGRDRWVAIEATRFVTAGAATTVTDTVDYELRDGPDGTVLQRLQAQRVEVAGVVDDPRDPDARGSLLRLDGDRVAMEGVFAAPGRFVDDGVLVDGAFVAACDP